MSWIAPVYFGDVPRVVNTGPTRFVVQGNVEIVRRNYESLLGAVDAVARQGSMV